MTTPESNATPDPQARYSPAETQLLESRRRANDISDLLNSQSTHEVQRHLVADDNGVSWREFLTEIGGVTKLHDYLTDGGHPDPARINPVIDRIFNRTSVAEYAGGMTIRHHPKNRKPQE